MGASVFRAALYAVAAGAATARGPVVVFSNSPTVTFGIAGNTVTASAAGGGGGVTQGTFFATGNTTQSSTGTIPFSSFIFRGSGVASVGISNGSVIVDVPAGGGGLTQATLFATGNTTQSSTGTQALSSLIFNGAGGASVGITGGSVVVSAPAIATNVFDVGSAGSTGTTPRYAPEDHVHAGILRIGVSTLGNTAGNTGSSHGQFIFAATGGITASMSTGAGGIHTIWHSVATQSNQAFSASGGSSTFQTLFFENANGVTFSNVAGNVRASYTVPTVTNSSWTVSDAATSGTVARLAFTNLNGVTLSLSSGTGGLHTIVGSHNGLTSQSGQAFSAAGGSSAFQTLGFSDNAAASFTNTNGSVALASVRASLFAVSNTTQSSSGTVNLNAVSFAGAGIASVGVTGGTVVVSVPAGGGGGDGGVFAGVSTGGNTAGSTGTVSTGNFVLVGSDGITLSQSTGAAGSAATVSILGGHSIASQWAPYAIGQQGGGGAQGQATLHLNPVSAGFEATMDRIGLYCSRSNATNSTGSMTISGWFGLYTRGTGGSSTGVSLWHSASSSFALTFHGTVSSASEHFGPRLFTLGFSTSVSRGEYWAAVITRTTTGGAGGTWNQMLISQFTANFSGVLGVASAASRQEVLGKGVYTVSTTGIPASIAFSEINGTASLAMRAPIWVAMNGTI